MLTVNALAPPITSFFKARETAPRITDFPSSMICIRWPAERLWRGPFFYDIADPTLQLTELGRAQDSLLVRAVHQFKETLQLEELAKGVFPRAKVTKFDPSIFSKPQLTISLA